MTGTNELLDVITFCCPACQARLTVPERLAGIEGPCPSCYHAIRAPERPALTAPPPVFRPPVSPPVLPLETRQQAADFEPQSPPRLRGMPDWNDTTPIMLPPVFPPPRTAPIEEMPQIPEARVAEEPGQARTAIFQDLMNAGQDKGFKARLAIRPPEDLDDSWKSKHREQQRGRRRVRRAERAAQSFLDSRGFRFARAGLILLSGGMLTWLFLHMKDNQWSLPGMSRPVAGDSHHRPAVPPMKPAAPAHAADLPGDDDAEIPAASDRMPAGGGTPSANIAAPPR